MSLADLFDEDAVGYDKWRPTYCPELFTDIIDYAQSAPGCTAVEIGIGTGQATGPFLELGCNVTAVEPGKNLAAFSKQKFRGYNNLNVVNSSFENYVCDNASIDLVYSATAFHWIPEDIGYPKIYRILKDGGTLALFWNRPSRPDDSLHQSMQEIYEKYMPFNKLHLEDEAERCRKIAATIDKYGFRDIEVKLYHAERQFSADDYIGLLNTYSDHRALEPEVKKNFDSEMRQTIIQFGDVINIYDTIDLYLARK